MYFELIVADLIPFSFQKINIASHQFEYSTTEAKKEGNKPYNRYRDVSPCKYWKE